MPDAVVYNRGPENLAEYVKRRRRIATGQMQNTKATGYAAASHDTPVLLKVMLKRMEVMVL